MPEANVYVKLLVSAWIGAISVSIANASEIKVQPRHATNSQVRQYILAPGTALPDYIDLGLGTGSGRDLQHHPEDSGLDYYLSMHSRTVSGQASPVLMYWPHLRAYSEGDVRPSNRTQLQCENRGLSSASKQREKPLDTSFLKRRSAT